MQYLWLKKDNNKNLILYFNGWGMNETHINHLKSEDCDILEVFDYRNLDFDFSEFDFSKYDKKYLVCWSMGVFAANKFSDFLNNFDRKIAINGTKKVIDDNFGIPKKIYNITAKLLNQDSLDKFIKNMFDNGNLNPNITITRELKELKEELIAIQKIELNENENINFDKAIISKNDRIIPTKNQINFWQADKARYELINSTHCPFEIYSNWSEIIC